jgi:dipeptidase D
VKLLTRILWNAYQEFDVRIADINVGNLRNAIAREGTALITLPTEHASSFEAYLKQMNHTFKI